MTLALCVWLWCVVQKHFSWLLRAHSHQAGCFVPCRSMNIPPPQTPAALSSHCPSPDCAEAWLPPLHVSSHRSTTCTLLYFIVKRTLRAVGAQWRPTQWIRLSLYQPCVCWVIVFVDTTVVKRLQREMVAWAMGHFQRSVSVLVHKSLYRAAVHLFQLCWG